ncbi:hypothetical protein BKA66DRAFT_411433 [Pyrenochaeta sp. MPI-SDFR-AT-0127]|nr:hypothetical protein BKA66DRAFT_411433 [Pyrenochaeta sp. MPI-SDFR-AT-0127]
MELIRPNEYRPDGLPKLRTSKAICRRDSLSSSRTRDSGYNSDLDVSLSPLDFVVPDQDAVFASLPPVPNLPIITESTLWHTNAENSLPSRQSKITSSFVPAESTSEPKLEWNISSEISKARNILECPAQIAAYDSLESQDDDIERWIKDNLPSRDRPQERVSSITSLSSTSSCDMYSNTDISDDEQDRVTEAIQALHPRSTIKVVELIMRKIELHLRYAAHKQCTRGTSSSSRSATGVVNPQASRKTSQSSGQKRKSRLEGSPPSDDDDDDIPNKRRRGSMTTTDGSETGVRFACPFYKDDPDRYRSKRTCPGPGWPTVHRMKEHLYRSHSQPIFCPICYSTFKSDKDQLNHVRLQQCQRSAPQQIEGIDRETVYILRRRTTALRLEEDKWRDVYHVLFPDVPVADIPSPFYDCDSPSETSRRFRRELLRRVQEELLRTAEQLPGPVEPQLLRLVANIIRTCENELLHPMEPSIANALPSDRRTSNSSTASAGSLVPSLQHTMPVPAPAPDANRIRRPSGRIPSRSSERVNGPIDHYPIAATPAEPHVHNHYIPEPAVDFGPIIWDDQTYNAFGDGLDWDALLSMAPDVHMGANEPFAALSAPMHIR